MASKPTHRIVGILGTGNFGCALAKRFYTSGYHVIIGSRRPDERKLPSFGDCLCDISITSVEECIKRSSIIFIAVHVENYKDCLQHYADMIKDKILVDVSNRYTPSKITSNAEYLQKIVPNAAVVKGFNCISAYAMENERVSGSRLTYIASNDVSAREKISNLARDIGLAPVDMGCLRSSRKIESFPTRLFPEWRAPMAFTVGVFNLWLLYIVFIYFVEKTQYHWDQLFVKVLNKPLCMTAITVLSCVYLPSSVAGLFQLFYGTKHKRFPKWLDKWLQNRKQLGIISFILVLVHVLMSILIMSPTYLKSWYRPAEIVVPLNRTTDLTIPLHTWMVWKGEASCLVGIVAFVMLCLMAVSTISSVADSLNWREWRFIQSKLGHLVVLLSVTHVVIMGAPGWIKGGPIVMIRSITFLSSLLPILTFILKVVLTTPCIKKHLSKIRRGWERLPKKHRIQETGTVSSGIGSSSCSSSNSSSVGYSTLDKVKCGCSEEEMTVINMTGNEGCACAELIENDEI